MTDKKIKRTATKEYRAAWRDANREKYNEYHKKWRDKNREHLSKYIKLRRAEVVEVVVKQPINLEAQECGHEYDPIACPLRHKCGILKECRECKVF